MNFFDTLQYVDGNGATQEIALNQVNVASLSRAVKLVMTPQSHKASTFTITWAQPPEIGVAVPFKSRCVVYASRTSVNGSQNSFTAGSGTILFQGRRTDNPGSAAGSRVTTEIALSDALWDLSKLTFQGATNIITGGTIANPVFTPFYWPDVVLFQAVPNAVYNPVPVNGTISTWQQILAIINYATAAIAGTDAVQLQIGPVPEFVPVYCNWYPLRASKCHEALEICLRPHPGVFTEIDYATTPPTIHFRNRAAMTAVNLPYKSSIGGITHVASDIEPLNQLVADAVRLYYKVIGTFNGQSVVGNQQDFWPLNAPTSLLCMDYLIDVTGAALSQTTCTFSPVNFDPTLLATWRAKVASLQQQSAGGQVPNDGTVGALQLVNNQPYNAAVNIKGIQVIGDDGTDYSTTYGALIPYLVCDVNGREQKVFNWFTLPPGMPAVKVVAATVKAFFSYTKISSAGSGVITDVVGEHQHTMRVLLCNVPPGQYILNQILNTGEAIPAGLAQAIWTELQVLQWKLRHQILQLAPDQATVPTIIKPGKHCINLTGGNAAWQAMNAVPESVTIQFYRTADGKLVALHTINCGPVNHLEPGYIVQLMNLFVNRNRQGIDAHQALTGKVSSNQTDLTGSHGKENSLPAEPVPTITNLAYVLAGVLQGQVINSAQRIAQGEQIG